MSAGRRWVKRVEALAAALLGVVPVMAMAAEPGFPVTVSSCGQPVRFDAPALFHGRHRPGSATLVVLVLIRVGQVE